MPKETPPIENVPSPVFGEQQGPALIPFDAYAKKEEKLVAELSDSAARASIDLPTGMLNKSTFEGLVADRVAEAESASEAEPTLAALLMDTTGYKTLNDTLGHHVGDQYLVDLAHALPHWFRPEDAIAMIGRIGGDELAVMLDLKPREIYEPEHQEQAERTKGYSPEERLAAVMNRFEECKEEFFASQPDAIRQLHADHVVDLAVGAKLWRPGMDAKALFQAADAVMYENKQEQHSRRDRKKYEELDDTQRQALESAIRLLREHNLDDEARKLES